jgi:hypothetical protein
MYSILNISDIALINLLHVYKSSATLFKRLFQLNKMKSFTGLVSVIFVALLANTANAVPTYPGPPTSSVLDFTLYKTAHPDENQCYTQVDVVHVSPNDLIFYGTGVASTACNTADFYVGQIDTVAWGWNCQSNYSCLLS